MRPEAYCVLVRGRCKLTRVGHGSGIVVGTGKDTEFGVVFEMMQDVSYLFVFEEQETCSD